MAITFALHEATRTGAPRLGALIARELQRARAGARHRDEGRAADAVAARDAGRRERHGLRRRRLLLPACRSRSGVRLAGEMLEREPSDIVYVNSLAASVFALAAAALKRKTMLHVHEKSADMANLLLHDVTKLEVDARGRRGGAGGRRYRAPTSREMFRHAPAEVRDLRRRRSRSRRCARPRARAAATPLNARRPGAGRRASALLVGMSGHASARKGADIFFEIAAATARARLSLGRRLAAGGDGRQHRLRGRSSATPRRTSMSPAPVDNPYPLHGDDGPVLPVVARGPEPARARRGAGARRRRCCASRTRPAIADRLGRCAVLCYGKPNVADAVRVLRAMSAEAVRRPAFRDAGAGLRRRIRSEGEDAEDS